jgi:hypothetical protein
MAFVQAVSASTSAQLNILNTPGITTTTGNFLVMGTSVLNNGNNPVPSDSNTNAWTGHSLNPIVITGQNNKGYSWYAKNITGGSNHTFTVTSSLTANSSIVVCEFSGRALDFPVASQGGGFETVATGSHSTGSVTTPFSGCDLCAFNFTSSSVQEFFNTGGIWAIPTNGSNTNGAQYKPSFAQVYGNSAQGTFNNTWQTTGETTLGAGFIYAIKQPSHTVIQQISGSTGLSSSGITLPPSSQVAFTTGNLVLYVAKYSSTTLQSVTITDTLNNTWQQISSFFDPAGNIGMAFGFAKNIVGGQDNVTLTIGNTVNFVALLCVEVAGLSQTNPFTTGEFVINRVTAPGNGANGIASAFTGSIARRPAMLFGFVLDSQNGTGQVLTPGTGFNALSGVWTFGGNQNSSLPEYQRI